MYFAHLASNSSQSLSQSDFTLIQSLEKNIMQVKRRKVTHFFVVQYIFILQKIKRSHSHYEVEECPVDPPQPAEITQETCDYCLKTAESNKNGDREELLVCKDCNAKGTFFLLYFRFIYIVYEVDKILNLNVIRARIYNVSSFYTKINNHFLFIQKLIITRRLGGAILIFKTALLVPHDIYRLYFSPPVLYGLFRFVGK